MSSKKSLAARLLTRVLNRPPYLHARKPKPSGPFGGRIEALEDRTTPTAVAFDPHTVLPLAGSLPLGVEVADLTGDGKPDVVAGYLNGAGSPDGRAVFAVFPGVGDGTFGPAQTFDAGTGSGGGPVVVGDFNNDGHPDVVLTAGVSTAGGFGNRVSVSLANGAGGFAAPIVFTTGGSDNFVRVADFNEDGNADLAIHTADAGRIAVHFGNGTGHFPTGTEIPLDSPTWGAANHQAVDLNGDSHTDIAVALSQGTNQVKVYYGTGTGAFTTGPVIGIPTGAVTGLVGLAAADLNADGVMDLAAGVGTQVFVYRGTGGGAFAAPAAFPALPTGGEAGVMDVADFDGDGHADLAVSNNTQDVVAVLRGGGDGTFAAPETFAARQGSGYSQGFRAADLNGDGRPDLVATSHSNPQPGVTVLINQTAVTPPPPPNPTGPVARWAGDSTFADATGRGHDAAPHNGVGFTPAVQGGGFSFDGVDDYLLVPDAPDLDFTTAFTVEGWIRVDQPPPPGYASSVVNKDSLDESQGRSWSLGVNSDGRLFALVSDDGTGASAATMYSAATVPVGSFAHVAVVFDGPAGRADLYVNGQLSNGMRYLNSGHLPASVFVGSEPIQIGAYRQAFYAYSFSDMAIDELALYDRALSTADIGAIYTAHAATNAAPTATAGGPYATTYGGGLTLTAAGSADPDGDALTYNWTVNGHAAAATGVSPSLTWAALTALGVTSAGAYTVAVTVDDGHGHVVTSAAAALAVNRATLTVTAPGVGKTYGTAITVGGTVTGVVTGDGIGYTFASAGAAAGAGVAGSPYPITAALSDPNGRIGNYDVTATLGTVTVTRATPTVVVPDAAFVFDGQPHPAAGSVVGVGGANLGTPAFTYSYTDDNGQVITTAAAPVEPGYYTVTATFPGDPNYAAAAGTATLTIVYEARTLTDLSRAFNAGRTIPIKIQLLDAAGNNISSSGIDLSALRLERVNADGSRTQVELQDAGNANLGDLFRYDAALGAYIFNLSTKGLSAGTYVFTWGIEGDPLKRELWFRLA